MRTLLLLVIISFGLNARAQHFTISDTTFEVDNILITYDIWWDFDHPQILDESFPFLDSLINFLTTNKGLILEVGCHTDYRGNSEYNAKLTEHRAKSAVYYLLENGMIDPKRLMPKGYGESEPIIPEDSIVGMETKEAMEYAHYTNRRTEFKILSTEYTPSPFFSTSDTYFTEGAILRNYDIRWDLAKSTLQDTSYYFLDQMVDFMNAHSNTVLDVGVHTDSRGSDMYSIRLEQNRAESITDYMIAEGIAPDRLIPKGYGESQLLISDKEIAKMATQEEKEMAHQTNRRTEFKILSLDYIPEMEADPVIPEKNINTDVEIEYDYE